MFSNCLSPLLRAHTFRVTQVIQGSGRCAEIWTGRMIHPADLGGSRPSMLSLEYITACSTTANMQYLPPPPSAHSSAVNLTKRTTDGPRRLYDIGKLANLAQKFKFRPPVGPPFVAETMQCLNPARLVPDDCLSFHRATCLSIHCPSYLTGRA